MKRWYLFGLGLLVLLVGVWLAQTPLLAAAATINLLIPEGSWRPLMVFTPEPVVREQTLKSSTGQEVLARVYQPREAGPHTGVVLYTPLIGGGLDDPRLVNLAETLARSGFMVAVPWREREQLLLSELDREDIVVTAEFMRDKLLVEQLGLFGISYGTGPVFAAAADERLTDDVAFIVSLNGLADLQQVIRFISTSEYSYGEISGKLTPHSYPQEILENNLHARRISLDRYLASSDFARLRAELSPALLLDTVSAELLIVHSTSDTFIPFTESLRLHEAAQGRLVSRLVLTDVLEHGTLRKLTPASLVRHYVPTGWDFYWLVYRLLSAYR